MKLEIYIYIYIRNVCIILIQHMNNTAIESMQFRTNLFWQYKNIFIVANCFLWHGFHIKFVLIKNKCNYHLIKFTL